MEFVEYKIKGMTCEHCASSIEREFENKSGVVEKSVDYRSGKGSFSYNPDEISKEDIISTIGGTGHYSVEGELDSGQGPCNEYDLIIIGGGSGAFAAALKANESGVTVLMVNDELPIGGTCVNVGCVPSKTLIRAAETIHSGTHSAFKGINLKEPEVNFKEIIQQKHELVSQLRQQKYVDVIMNKDNIRMVEGRAAFNGINTILVNGKKQFTGKKFIIATGAKPRIPVIEGLEETGYQTNRTLFELENQPESLAIIGAGYIALELAQAYHRFGTKVKLIHHSERVLRSQTTDITDELTKHLSDEGIEIHLNTKVRKVSRADENTILITAEENGKEVQFRVSHILIATGIIANTVDLGLEILGVKLDETGSIIVNNKQETNIGHVYAIGDCTNTPSFVYTAAAEGKTASLNAIENKDAITDYRGLPWVVFTDPQVAGAGIDEKEASDKGIPHETSIISLKDVPRSIAARDTRGFIKLIRNTETDELLGMRVVAPEGGELVMQASMAIKYGIKVEEIVNSLHPYLTLSEGIKLAAITFNKDIKELSCCAV